jgi:phenylalanyl-tRNA synthetase beta chain
VRALVSWLRDFVDVPVPARTLAEDLGARGFEVAAVEPWPGEPDDAVIDLEITANRPDCLSVMGIAREVSVIYGVPLRAPAIVEPPAGPPAIPIAIDAPALCPRYVGALVDITVDRSPEWLERRLAAAGIRAINNVVDVTNYVLVETGHPLHGFDYERLAGGELRIRQARPGEQLVTLDGQTRALAPDMLVIADRERAQAVAGVMGGAESEISLGTRVMALESAYFQPASVRRTSKRLGLSTEASYRFERGADPAAPLNALLRACKLLRDIGAGTLRPGVVDACPDRGVLASRQVTLRLARAERLLGLAIEPAAAAMGLTGLGFTIDSSDPGAWSIAVPSWRSDVTREADLIEEVARTVGYDAIPATFPPLDAPPAPPVKSLERDRVARERLLAAGFSECVSFSFIEHAAARHFAADADIVSLANPLSEKLAVMRPSLLPGVVDAVSHNLRRERSDVRLFELGACFAASAGERRKAAFAWTGAASPQHWNGTGRAVDLYDVIGVVELLAQAFGRAVSIEPADVPFLAAGRSARLVLATDDDRPATALGVIGELRADVAASRDVPAGATVWVAELDVETLARDFVPGGTVRVAAPPRFPSVVRDLSVLVPNDLPAAAVRGTIRSVAPSTLVDVREFDRYQGRGVPAGYISLSVRLTFRAPDRTLTDDEVQQAVDRMVAALGERHGAVLR